MCSSFHNYLHLHVWLYFSWQYSFWRNHCHEQLFIHPDYLITEPCFVASSGGGCFYNIFTQTLISSFLAKTITVILMSIYITCLMLSWHSVIDYPVQVYHSLWRFQILTSLIMIDINTIIAMSHHRIAFIQLLIIRNVSPLGSSMNSCVPMVEYSMIVW